MKDNLKLVGMGMKMTGIFLFVLFSTTLSGQKIETLQFQEKLYDFGSVSEAGGSVIHEFLFTNISNDTIRIANVKASCGCTTPGWTKEPIPPGEVGFIKAKYNPFNRPGKFNKFLTVSLENNDEPLRLIIKGYVEPEPENETDGLTVSMGDIRVKYRALNLGKLFDKDTAVQFNWKILNAGTDTITFNSENEFPDFMKVSVIPNKLTPGSLAELNLVYNPNAINGLGFRNDNITLYTDEQGMDSVKSFSVYANIVEYFEPLTAEQLKNAPRISFNKLEHDFDRIKPGSEVETTFTVRNRGVEDLIIRKVEGNCSCVEPSMSKTILKNGEEALLKVTFNSTDRMGRQQKSVVVYSNAPESPIIRLILNAYVEQD